MIPSIGSRPWAVSRAAQRIREALTAADNGGYGRTGSAWASYMSRDDVEAVLEAYEEARK